MAIMENCGNNFHVVSVLQVIFHQLVEAAIEMEAKGVFHRDIKPENVLIENYDIITKARFIDFGCGTTFFPGQTFHGPQGKMFNLVQFRDAQFWEEKNS